MTAATSTASRLPVADPRPGREPDLWPRRRLVVVPTPGEEEPERHAPRRERAPGQGTVPGRLPRSVYRRRRAVVAVAAVAAIAGLLSAAPAVPVGAAPGRSAPVAASQAPQTTVRAVTIAPGDTLWEVAVAHAPAGTDPRAYLARLRELNGFDGSQVPAWTVVLLPDVRRAD